MPILTKKEICDKWLKDKTVNPQTLRKIKENGAVYKELQKKCSLNQKSEKNVKLSKKEICDKWLKDKTVNPQTLRKIKENGAVYKELQKNCKVKSEIKSEIKSEVKTEVKTAPDIISSNRRKINAANKIKNLFIPYIKRVSVNIIDRINYYIIIKKYLLSIKETKNCVRLYNIDPKTNLPIYRVGNKIILDKQIGTKSAYGIIYLSHFKSNVKYGNNFDKLNKFAVKITNQGRENKKEIKVLTDLTKLVIDFKCPHFPISYGYLRCNNSRIKSNNDDDHSIIKNKHKVKKLFPELINKNKSLLIQLNELASGDLRNNLLSNENKDILNSFAQILLAIMFFHYYTNCHHYDSHSGNFLYHKITPGGYFHYNINNVDYYLENKGYLWVVWDFGIVEPYTKNNKYGAINTTININFDFNYVIKTFLIFKDYIKAADYAKIELFKNIIKTYDIYKDPIYLNKINKEILKFLCKNVSTFTKIKPLNIINKTPYTIIYSSSPIKSSSPVKKSFIPRFLNFFNLGYK